MADITLHKAASRGHANHGWLDSHHSFSFAGYHDPERIHFGALRVLNDDIVRGGMGFGKHPHNNMEIVSIPLRGALEHNDNTGRHAIIKTGDVQIMSAGTGIAHSEFNASKTEEVNFLQVWVFPKVRNIAPRYEQKSFDAAERKNRWQEVVSPTKQSDSLWINQDAWFSLGDFDKGSKAVYTLHKEGNGVYAFMIEGEVDLNEQTLGKRDGAGFSEVETVSLHANADSKILLIEVPLHFNI